MCRMQCRKAIKSYQDHFLTVHEKTKHFKCYMCETEFYTQQILESHIRNIHGFDRRYFNLNVTHVRRFSIGKGD